MSWDYRLLSRKYGNSTFLEIHEVYYDEDGKPYSYTAKEAGVCSEDLEGVHRVLNRMIEATTKPILSFQNFPEEYVKE